MPATCTLLSTSDLSVRCLCNISGGKQTRPLRGIWPSQSDAVKACSEQMSRSGARPSVRCRGVCVLSVKQEERLVGDDIPDLSPLLVSVLGVSSEEDQRLYMLRSSLCFWLEITSFMHLSPLVDSFSASYLAFFFPSPAFSPSACVHHSPTGFEENTFLSIKTQYGFFFF